MTVRSPAASSAPRTWSRFVPAMAWLPHYPAASLRPDIIAALTVWALVVPQAIAYAQIAGLPPQHGLFAAAGGLLGYGLLGTSRQLIVSPTSSTAAISAALVGAIALGDVARLAPLSAALAILSGIALGLLGAMRLGFVSRFIPTAVQVGFMFGLGLTIIVGQVAKVLGVPSPSGTFLEQLRGLLVSLPATNVWALALGLAALASLLLLPRVAPRLPVALAVVIGGIVAVAVLGLADRGVEVIGLVEGAIPFPAIPAIEPGDLMALVPGAIAIAVVGSAEGLTVAQQFAERHRYEIDADQELRAVGGANALAGLFQGFIVGGGASQSAAADRAGATSPIVSLMVAGLTAITAAVLLPLFADLPQPVLGAIVISAVLGFLRVAELRRIAALRRDSFGIAMVALVATLLLGILPGLITAVALSILVLLLRMARPTISRLGIDAGGATVRIEEDPGAGTPPGVLVLRPEGPMLYLAAGLIRDEVREAMARSAAPTLVILDLSLTPDLDVETLDILVRLDEQARELGISLRLAEVRGDAAAMLERARILGMAVPADHRTVAEALAADPR